MRRIIITFFVAGLLFTACNVKEKSSKDVLVNDIYK